MNLYISGITLLSIIFALLSIKPIITLKTYLWRCFFRYKYNFKLEDNMKIARLRNRLSLALLSGFCVLLYQCNLFSFKLLNISNNLLQLAIIFGIILIYIIIRSLLHNYILKHKLEQDKYLVISNLENTFFIILCLFLCLSISLSLAFTNDVLIIKNVILISISFIYSIFLIRKMQILLFLCSPLLSILYLCILEVIPSAMLISIALLL